MVDARPIPDHLASAHPQLPLDRANMLAEATWFYLAVTDQAEHDVVGADNISLLAPGEAKWERQIDRQESRHLYGSLVGHELTPSPVPTCINPREAGPFYLRYHVVTEKLANDGAGDLSSKPRRLPRIEHRIGVGKKAAKEGKLILVNMLEIVPRDARSTISPASVRTSISITGIPHQPDEQLRPCQPRHHLATDVNAAASFRPNAGAPPPSSLTEGGPS